jgi:uncharacterized protein
VGEALVSFLDEKGRPGVTERVYVLPPGSQIGPITADQRKALMASSIVAGVYEKTVDRESAYEKLKGRTDKKMPDEAHASAAGQASKASAPAEEKSGGMFGSVMDSMGNIFGGGAKHTRATPGEQMIKSAASSIGREVGRQIIRGVLGSILGGRR